MNDKNQPRHDDEQYRAQLTAFALGELSSKEAAAVAEERVCIG